MGLDSAYFQTQYTEQSSSSLQAWVGPMKAGLTFTVSCGCVLSGSSTSVPLLLKAEAASASGGVAWFSSATLGILTARLVRVQLAVGSNSRLAGGLGGTSLLALWVVPAAAIDDDQGTHASTAPLVMLTTSDATAARTVTGLPLEMHSHFWGSQQGHAAAGGAEWGWWG